MMGVRVAVRVSSKYDSGGMVESELGLNELVEQALLLVVRVRVRARPQ